MAVAWGLGMSQGHTPGAGASFRPVYVEQTHTGGHRPSNNAKTEKRIGLVSYYMKAILYQATGGTRYYDMLWGPAVVHANNMNGIGCVVKTWGSR